MIPIDLLRKYQIKYTGEDAITNVEIAPNAGIETSKLLEGDEFFKRDGSVTATGDFNLGGNKIENGSPATNPTDFPILSQVQSLLSTTYIHTQATPSVSWIISHNLNTYPSVSVVNNLGESIHTEVIYSTPNTIYVNTNSLTTGKAYLNY